MTKRHVQRMKRQDSPRELGIERFFHLGPARDPRVIELLPPSLKAMRVRVGEIHRIRPMDRELWYYGSPRWKASACSFVIKELTGQQPGRLSDPTMLRHSLAEGGKTFDAWWWLCQGLPPVSATWCVFLHQESAECWAQSIDQIRQEQAA